jgi:hypothetical protein
MREVYNIPEQLAERVPLGMRNMNNINPLCIGCNVSGDCWWLFNLRKPDGCPCHDCLIKIICEELCEKAIVMHPFYRKENDKHE